MIDTQSDPGSWAEALEQPRQRYVIELPFPPASLSGHNTGNRFVKAPIIAKHRQWAKHATQATGARIEGDGDILVRIDFYRPNKRGDRLNFPNRMKPLFDGIADALQVNDSRFVPEYHYHEGEKPGKVVVTIPATRADIFDGCTPVGEIAASIAKSTIMKAYENGVLTADETTKMIAEMGLKYV